MKRIKLSDWMMMTVIMMSSIMMSQSINAAEQGSGFVSMAFFKG